MFECSGKVHVYDWRPASASCERFLQGIKTHPEGMKDLYPSSRIYRLT